LSNLQHEVTDAAPSFRVEKQAGVNPETVAWRFHLAIVASATNESFGPFKPIDGERTGGHATRVFAFLTNV
jgi:hypothetical protein